MIKLILILMSKNKKLNAPDKTVENVTEIAVIALQPIGQSASGFNFESTLFIQYIKTTLINKKEALIVGSKISLSVFGET